MSKLSRRSAAGNVVQPMGADSNLLDMEEDLWAVKGLAFAINLIASSGGDSIQRGAANALWQIARQIENHADALREQWEAALNKQRAPV
jgi:hypothetical protein